MKLVLIVTPTCKGELMPSMQSVARCTETTDSATLADMIGTSAMFAIDRARKVGINFADPDYALTVRFTVEG